MGASVRKSVLIDEHNVDIHSLVWLDASVNATSENINVQQQLRTLIDNFKAFENTNDCFNCVRHIPKQNRILLVVSGRLGREIVPRIHRLKQVLSIYVYCMDKQKNEIWAQKYPKIKRVITNLDELVSQIKSDRTRREAFEIDESWSFNLYKKPSSDELSAKSVDMHNRFLHSKFFFDCLFQMKSNSTDRQQLITLCKDLYRGDQAELVILDNFEKTYTSSQALAWYTMDCCLTRLFNKAIREQTLEMLYLFRFFFRDIKSQMEMNRCSSTVKAYHGQCISRDDLQSIKNAMDGFISMNVFLYTYSNRQRALKNLPNSDEVELVLFEIDANPSLDGIPPFCNMKNLSYSNQDDEILFLIGSIFRINEINSNHDRMTSIRLTLCSDNDPQLKPILKPFKDEQVTILSFGDVLCRIGKVNEAEKYYSRLLTELPADDLENLAECYYALGNIFNEKDDYKLSSQWHERSLAIKKQIYSENNPSVADSYNSIADIQRKQGQSQQALELYEEALQIWSQAYNNDHPKIAMCLNNIGCIYGEEKNYEKTLEYHERALKIMEKHFAADHLCLGHTHNNIGSVYRYLEKYNLALEHYEIALKIKTKCFSSKHPSIASTLSNMACVYEDMHAYQQALTYFEKASAIYRHNFPPTSPENVRIINDIQRISKKLKH
ncbi:unnamed protein product [Adineta ricciae]|uniref:Uncharacterized protein n=1 Tax=Adineta ricciae TaxID=249248 RepID=A0A814PLX2_ADIRI|nr:unnamed protein product [Adineta ricciae]